MGKAKILIVDDVPMILDEEERILRSMSGELDIIRCGSGKDALKMILSHRPDIVFLDLILPDMHGDAVCKWVKSKDDLDSISVVIVTGRNDEEQLKRSFAAGCDAYVTKPFDEADLTNKVEILLSEKGVFLGSDNNE